MTCGIIVPRQEDLVGPREDGYLAECILPDNHSSCGIDCHVVLTPEGKYLEWKDDWGCDCCNWNTDQRCYTYHEITKKRFLELKRQAE